MTTSYAYSYTVLRYVHDIATGEFVNVGVALYAPDARYASALCRTTYGRLSRIFPGVNGDSFKGAMRYIQSRFDQLGDELANQLPLRTAETVLDLARTVLPPDDSALQWAPVGGGRTEDPSRELEKLYERMVMRYEERQVHEGRTDQEVWRGFRRSLEERRLLQLFQPKKIAVQDDEVEFQHAWKNGVWHCLEPISFDLATAESIRDKAHRWLGQITSIKTTDEPFTLYLLVGSPRQEELQVAFENALSILGKIPVEKRIFQESEAPQLSTLISMESEAHQGQLTTP